MVVLRHYEGKQAWLMDLLRIYNGNQTFAMVVIRICYGNEASAMVFTKDLIREAGIGYGFAEGSLWEASFAYDSLGIYKGMSIQELGSAGPQEGIVAQQNGNR